MDKYSILYVDDSSLNLEVFQDEFSDIYRVYTCNSPQNCIEKITKLKPDLVILDVHMPELSGTEVLKKMRKDSRMKNVPVMFYSVDDSDENLVKGLSLGAEDFLLRSMSKAHIKARINSRLASFYNGDSAQVSSFLNLSLELNDHCAQIDNKRVSLTLIEYKILDFLLRNRDNRVLKENLISAVWNKVHVQSRTLNTHLSNLRSKIKDANFVIKVNRNNQILLLPQDKE